MLIRPEMAVSDEIDWLGEAVKPKRGSPERDFQVVAVRWLRLALPAGSIVAAVKNEEQARGRTEGQRIRFHQRRKATGVLPGFYDLALVLPARRVVWCELKAPGGSLSEAQRAVHAATRDLGHDVIVARSLDELERQLRALGVPLKAAAG